MKVICAAILCVSTFLCHRPVAADPWKDESGKGWRGSYERDDDRQRHDRRYRPPRGHAPPPGECRIWYPGEPAGQQPPPFRC